jgi:hypothetical protein
MAIKNTALGGTNWAGEELKAVDLNDTFNAAVSKIQSLSAFWLNTDLYDVFDDFESYSVGNFATGVKWTLTTSGSGSNATIVSSTNSGGSGKELKLLGDLSNANDQTVTVYSNTLSNNKHTFVRCYSNLFTTRAATTSFTVSIDGTNYFTVASCSAVDIASAIVENANSTSLIFVVAKGSDVYDLYIGGKNVQADVNVANLEIYFRLSYDYISATASRTPAVYIDDVRQAKSITTA